MGLSVNNVVIAGNLTRDIELRHTTNGKAVCNIGLASNSPTKKEEQIPVLVTVVAWDKIAESCSQYLKKGDGIIVVGRLQSRMWEKDGQKRSVIEVVADNIQFVTKKRDTAAESMITEEPQHPPME